jgi:hypothetical protein
MLFQISELSWIETLDIENIGPRYGWRYPDGTWKYSHHKDYINRYGGEPIREIQTCIRTRSDNKYNVASHPHQVIEALSAAGINIAGNPKFGS